MEKKWIIIITMLVIIGIVLATILGIYAYKNGSISDTNIKSNKELAEIEVNEEKKINKDEKNEIISTAAINELISPNAIIIEKRYYKACDHLLRNVVEIPMELINKTEEDIKHKYSDWKLEKYSSTEITMYKEYNGFCDEHYIVKAENGVITIYTINEKNIEKLKEETDISVQYLPEEDLEKLKVGIYIVGKTNLYSFLEDYE